MSRIGRRKKRGIILIAMNIWIFRSNKHILLKNSFAIHIMEDTSVQSACPISATRTLVSPLEKIPLSKWQTLSRKNASRGKFTKRFREREREGRTANLFIKNSSRFMGERCFSVATRGWLNIASSLPSPPPTIPRCVAIDIP